MLNELERKFFDIYKKEPTLLFMLGASRTGSTPMYQMIVNSFDVFYFTNLINNCFCENPILGVSLQKDDILNRGDIGYNSNFGKTEGLLGPSESSNIFKNWFGGGHPSELKSFDFLPGKKDHMVNTMSAISSMTEGMLIVTKNAWNIFRIKTIVNTFSNAYFLWIRRDIRQASLSSLNARYERGDLNAWNTATPKNYKEITILKSPHKQVVEQHYLLDKTIGDNIPKDRHIKIWYEDLCYDTKGTIDKIGEYFISNDIKVGIRLKQLQPLQIKGVKEKEDGDYRKIEYYSNKERFKDYKHESINNISHI